MSSSLSRLACAGILCAAASCGDQLVNVDYPGEPLAVVQGHLTASAPWSFEGALGLATVWVRFTDHVASAALVQHLEYRPVFPAAYSFGLYAPPPEGTVMELSSLGAGRVAEAFVVAFVDQDGDGLLSFCPSGGGAVDRIVGSSVPTPALVEGKMYFMILYVDGPPPPRFPDAPQGYSLWGNEGRQETTLRPFSTPVDIELTGSSDLPPILCRDSGPLGGIRSSPWAGIGARLSSEEE